MADTSNTVASNRPSKRKPPGPPRWKKGESGNPKGYSEARRTFQALNKLCDQTQVAEAWAKLIQAGVWPAVKEAIDRADGKVPDKLEATTETTVRVVREDPDA